MMEQSDVFKGTRSHSAGARVKPSKTGEDSSGRDDMPGLTLQPATNHTGDMEAVNVRCRPPMERGPKIFGGESTRLENRARVPGNGERGDGLAEVSHERYVEVDTV